MTLMYGEGSKAFGRLQEEILKTSRDLSILAWNTELLSRSSSLLAASVSDFEQCGDIIRDSSQKGSAEFWMTNVGLRGALPIESSSTSTGKCVLLLGCYRESRPQNTICLRLNKSPQSLHGASTDRYVVEPKEVVDDGRSRVRRTAGLRPGNSISRKRITIMRHKDPMATPRPAHRTLAERPHREPHKLTLAYPGLQPSANNTGDQQQTSAHGNDTPFVQYPLPPLSPESQMHYDNASAVPAGFFAPHEQNGGRPRRRTSSFSDLREASTDGYPPSGAHPPPSLARPVSYHAPGANHCLPAYNSAAGYPPSSAPPAPTLSPSDFAHYTYNRAFRPQQPMPVASAGMRSFEDSSYQPFASGPSPPVDAPYYERSPLAVSHPTLPRRHSSIGLSSNYSSPPDNYRSEPTQAGVVGERERLGHPEYDGYPDYELDRPRKAFQPTAHRQNSSQSNLRHRVSFDRTVHQRNSLDDLHSRPSRRDLSPIASDDGYGTDRSITHSDPGSVTSSNDYIDGSLLSQQQAARTRTTLKGILKPPSVRFNFDMEEGRAAKPFQKVRVRERPEVIVEIRDEAGRRAANADGPDRGRRVVIEDPATRRRTRGYWD